MRIELWRRLRIFDKNIFRETYDEFLEEAVEEIVGGRSGHKKKRVRVTKERIFSPQELDMAPLPKEKARAQAAEPAPIPNRPKRVEQRPMKKEVLQHKDLIFEDKEKMMESAGYGGTLFAEYKKYINEGLVPENLENVLSQVGRLFPFDVKSFAEEKRRKIMESESKKQVETLGKGVSEQWRESLAVDPLMIKLANEADSIKWAEKIKTWEGQDKSSRENEVLLLRGLMKIREMGMMNNETRNLFEKHKDKLARLGLMV